MPPRQSPPPAGPNNRRRSTPAMPNTWIWLFVLATVVVVMIILSPNRGGTPLDYSDFIKLINNGDVTDVTIFGKNEVRGNVRDLKRAEELLNKDKDKDKDKARLITFSGSTFSTRIPDTQDQAQLVQQWTTTYEKLKEKAPDDKKKDFNLKVSWQEEPHGWLGPVIMFMLPTLVVLGVIFLFMLPHSAIRSAAASSTTTSRARPAATNAARCASRSTTWPTCRTPRASCRRSSSS